MGASLKVLTYNTHLYGGTIPGALGGINYEDDERKAKILQQLQKTDADIVCLQEVWGDANRQWFRDHGGAQYFNGYFPADSGGLKISSGLLVLTKHKLSDTTFVSFSDHEGIDGWATKGFVSMLVRASDGSAIARLLVTHAQADPGVAHQKARKAQFGQLCRYIGDHAGSPDWSGVPLILCGDFNVMGEAKGGGWPTSEYRTINSMLEGVGLADAFRQIHPVSEAPPDPGYTLDRYRNKLAVRFGSDDDAKQQRLDYLYVNSHVSVTTCKVENFGWVYSNREGLMDLSDHYPVLMTYDVV